MFTLDFKKNFLCIFVALLACGSIQASTVFDTPPIELKDGNAWFQAISKKDEKQIKNLLVRKNSDLKDRQDKWGNTPLMAAAYKTGRINIMLSLLGAGEEINATNSNGDTALMMALFGDKEKERKETVQCLLDYEPDLEMKNNQELNALMLAALNEHIGCLKLLIQAGANLESRGSQGRTALAQAVDNDNLESAKVLLHAKANIETRDQFTFTPLMIAALHDNLSMIKLLIKSGADLNAKTALEIPVSKKKDLLDLMPKKEYIPKGATPLFIAKRYGSRAVEKAIREAGGKE